MDDLVKERYWTVWDMAQRDERYAQMLKENGVLEEKYDRVLQSLPDDQRDIIQDFLMNCEALSERMLEVACTLMRFSDEK